ncbi:colicin transporter [Enterobacteriaceae bacterium RIT693]|nr:colicin transporter [Enterobacteriaceae bacterium RIT693]
MKLSPKAAIEVCEEATRRGVFVGIVEAGHWYNPGFQPDMSTRWDSLKFYKDIDIKLNNDIAIENINGDVTDGYTAFLITVISQVSD